MDFGIRHLVAFAITLTSICSDARAGSSCNGGVCAKAAPGYVMRVDRGNRTVRVDALGSASVELGVPLAMASRFRIGSVTKPIVAATVLRLQEKGRLSIDDRLNRFLPAYPDGARITLRQLLGHTSGVSDAWEADAMKPVTTGQLVDLIGRQPLDFAPGTQWRYSNSGYMLLGAVVEAVEQRPWCDVVRDVVLRPARMDSSGCFDDDAVVPNAATGYTHASDESLRRAPYISITGPGAAGALYSTVGDLQRFMHALTHAIILQPQSLAAMTTEQQIPGQPGTGYGLGWFLTTVHGMPAWEHNGGIEGFAAQLTYLPKEDVAVAVLANVDAGSVLPRSLAHRGAAKAAGAPYPDFLPGLCAKDCSDLAGRYRSEAGDRNIVLEGSRIYSQRESGPRRPLQYAQGDRLIFVGDGTDYFEIIRDASGKPSALLFHPDAAPAARREVRVQTP